MVVPPNLHLTVQEYLVRTAYAVPEGIKQEIKTSMHNLHLHAEPGEPYNEGSTLTTSLKAAYALIIAGTARYVLWLMQGRLLAEQRVSVLEVSHGAGTQVCSCCLHLLTAFQCLVQPWFIKAFDLTVIICIALLH